MGAQSGKDLLIKLDLTGGGQFETVAGLRATRLSFNQELLVVSVKLLVVLFRRYFLLFISCDVSLFWRNWFALNYSEF